jgi:hypothetical protein
VSAGRGPTPAARAAGATQSAARRESRRSVARRRSSWSSSEAEPWASAPASVALAAVGRDSPVDEALRERSERGTARRQARCARRPRGGGAVWPCGRRSDAAWPRAGVRRLVARGSPPAPAQSPAGRSAPPRAAPPARARRATDTRTRHRRPRAARDGRRSSPATHRKYRHWRGRRVERDQIEAVASTATVFLPWLLPR